MAKTSLCTVTLIIALCSILLHRGICLLSKLGGSSTCPSTTWISVYVPGKSNVFADGLSRRPDLRLTVVGALSDKNEFLKEICEGVQKEG
jgi:hypothetical protein